jgi:hypothetical protein
MPLLSIDFVRAQGQTIEEMRDHIRSDPKGQELIRRGDTILVWVNEGDAYMLNMNVDIYNMNLSMGTHNNPEEGI